MATSTAPQPASTGTTDLAPRLRMVVMRLARRLRQVDSPATGITMSQLSALAVVERQGPLTLGELATAERVQPPTMTRIVAKLEEDGLLERTIDPDDRRVARVAATPAGRRLLETTRRRRAAFLAGRIAALTPEERATLAAAATIIERMLEDDG